MEIRAPDLSPEELAEHEAALNMDLELEEEEEVINYDSSSD